MFSHRKADIAHMELLYNVLIFFSKSHMMIFMLLRMYYDSICEFTMSIPPLQNSNDMYGLYHKMHHRNMIDHVFSYHMQPD